MIESKNVDAEVVDELKNTEEFNTLMETLQSAHEKTISVKNCYAYKSKNESKENYIIVFNIDSKSEDSISIVFKMSEDNNIIDCSASFDEISSGEPDVSHILDFEDDEVKIRSIKNQ